MNILKAWLSPAHKMTPQERRRVTNTVTIGSLAIVAAILAIVIWVAKTPVGSDSQMWASVMLAQVAAPKLVLAVALSILGFVLAFLETQIYEITYLGRRTVVPESEDTSGVMSIKVGNHGTIFAMLALANIAGLMLGVLK